MKQFILFAFIFVLVSCKEATKTEKTVIIEKSTEITIEEINYDGLELLLNKQDDKTYVINFWATWCKPCVEELPSFQQLYENYKDKNVEVILVSLDFKNQLETRLIPFIKEHNLKPTVVLMVDPDQNTWIPKVNTEWSGAVPATIIYNKNKRAFFEQSFTYKKLETELNNIFKTN
ncbi:TlpA family protein disulfide reductase [Flavobacterium sp.]|uniref:TlpA family protein disulfide reductase n=1 Tax=Flavobacterium sp. TaxID=239 RepID=UPI004048A1F8